MARGSEPGPDESRGLRGWRVAPFAAVAIALALVHLHGLEIFHRIPIKHDDEAFVWPLASMTLTEYFTRWLPGTDRYAFPLRDLAFWLDFRISAWTGVQLVWVTQLVYLVMALWALRGVAVVVGQHLGWSRFAADLFVAVIGLHPTSVEMVQWLSVRKHLLPALLVAIGTQRALLLRLDGRTPSTRDWLTLTALYLASLLCYPSAALWLPWLLWLFREHLRARCVTAAVLGATALAALLGTAILVVGRNSAFSEHAHLLLTSGELSVAAENWLQGVGRGFANFVLPWHIGPYYTPHSPLALGGIVLFVGALAWVTVRVLRTESPTRRLALDLLVLALALFIPSSYVLVNTHEYIWGDHYAFLPEAYFLLALAVLAPAEWAIARWPRPLRLATVPVLAVLVLRSAMAAEPWRSDLVLFAHCADHEGAPRCAALAIQKEYDAGGCAAAIRHILEARERFRDLAPLDHVFETDVPFYDGLCVALRTDLDPAAASAELRQLAVRYRGSQGLVFPSVLLQLRQRDVTGARQIAYGSYMDPTFEIRGVTAKMIDLLRGQAEALCQVSIESEAAEEDCRRRQAALLVRTRGFPVNEDHLGWGLGTSIAPFTTPPGTEPP